MCTWITAARHMIINSSTEVRNLLACRLEASRLDMVPCDTISIIFADTEPLSGLAYCVAVLPYLALSVLLQSSTAMPDLDDGSGSSRERGKEQQCLLMHPCASVVPGSKHFYPYGEQMRGGRIMTTSSSQPSSSLLQLIVNCQHVAVVDVAAKAHVG